MTASADPARHAAGLGRALRGHLRTPLLRDGYALVLNSGLTAAMGLVFWLLAAHSYSARTLGIDAAAISAMMFLAGIAQLNLMSAMLRFVPVSGAHARRLVLSAYAIAVGLAGAAGLAFVVGVPAWAPSLAFLRDPAFGLWFVAATMAWCIFNLQDSVLTGLGRAVLVPVENQIFSTAKIVLVLAFAAASPRHGIFASWTAGLLFSLVPVNLVIFRRLLPAHAHDRGPHVHPPTRRDVARFVSADYAASLCWLAATFLMPVLVLALQGPTDNAMFALAWMVAWPLFGISANTGAALVVSGARDEARLGEYVRIARRQTLRLVAPVALLLAAAAPLVLRLFGAAYAAGASDTLRLLSLAAIPNIVVALAVSARRVARRMRAVVGIVAGQSGLVIALSLVLLPRLGVAGVGVAWLVAGSTLAVVLLVIDRARPAVAATPATVARDVAADLGALRALRWLSASVPHGRRRRRADAVAPAILASTPWTPHRSLRTVTDMAVLTAGPAGGVPCVIVKCATTPAAARSLEAEARTLAALWADSRLEGWRRLLPVVLDRGEQAGAPYVVEELLPGRAATDAMSSPTARDALVGHAAQAIGGLHRATAADVRVDDERLRRWVDAPLGALGGGDGRAALSGAVVAALRRELWAGLLGRRTAVSWVHGDYVPENILFTPPDGRVTGIVDWELARPADLPLVDVVTLLLAARMQASRRELGRVVCDWLGGARSTAFEQRVLQDAAAGLPGDAVDERALVLLAWLRHVAGNVTKAPGYATHNLWRRSNIDPVARAVAPSR